MAIIENGLSTITVKKSALILKLEDNLQLHLQAYKEAVVVYRTALRDALVSAAEASKDFTKPAPDLSELMANLPVPHSYEKEYTKVLGMLNMSVKDEIVITEDQYRQFVMDEWNWKRSFESITNNYVVGRSR